MNRRKNAPSGRFSFSPSLVLLTLVGASLGWFSTNHFHPWVSWYAEAPFFAGILLAACGMLCFCRAHSISDVVIPSITWPFWFLLVLLVLHSVSGKLSFVGQSLIITLYLFLCIFSLWLGFVQASWERSTLAPPSLQILVALAWTVMVGAILSIAIAWAQVLQIWDGSSWVMRMSYPRRPGGNIGQPNHLATLVVMATASVCYLYFTSWLKGFTVTVVMLYLMAGLVITESRTGLLSVMVLGLWCVFKHLIAPKTMSVWVLLLLIGALVTGHQLWPAAYSMFNGDLPTQIPGRIEQAATDARLVIWPQLLEAANLKPWFGWGFGQTTAAHNAVVDRYAYSQAFSYSHNLFIDLVVWLGWPIAIILTFVTAVWLWRRIRAVNEPNAWFGFALVLPLAVHSMLEFPFAYAYLLVPALLGLGAAEANLGVAARWRIDLKSAGIIVATVGSLAAWTAIEYLQVEEEFRKARFRMLRIGPDHLTEQGFQPVLLTQLGAIVRSSRLDLKAGMDPADLHLIKDVAMHTPWSAPQFRHAMASALNDQPAEAVRMLRVIRAQHGEKSFISFRDQINDKLLSSGRPPLNTD